MTLLVAVCVCVGLALQSAPALAATDPLEAGKNAYLANDFKRAYEILLPLAEQGNPDAQITLGIMFDYGQGVAKDDAQATGWYRKAAMQGMPAVQHNLGVKYFEGIGIGKDYTEAARWWRMAAKLGFAESQYSLGEMYAYGIGAPKQEDEAAGWYRLAAGQGHALAQYRLGVLYAAGRGVELDHAQAYRWLEKAAAQGMPQAQYQVGRFNEDGIGVRADPVAARKWYRQAVAQGYDKAQRRLAALERRERGEAAANSAAANPAAAAGPSPAPIDAAGDQPIPPASTPAFASDASRGAPHREDWIHSQLPQHFTLQLVTASSEQSVLDLLGRAGLGAEAAYFSRALNDHVGYTAIFGVFASREDALSALGQLPAEIQKTKPWVRSFAEVQALVR